MLALGFLRLALPAVGDPGVGHAPVPQGAPASHAVHLSRGAAGGAGIPADVMTGGGRAAPSAAHPPRPSPHAP